MVTQDCNNNLKLILDKSYYDFLQWLLKNNFNVYITRTNNFNYLFNIDWDFSKSKNDFI